MSRAQRPARTVGAKAGRRARLERGGRSAATTPGEAAYDARMSRRRQAAVASADAASPAASNPRAWGRRSASEGEKDHPRSVVLDAHSGSSRIFPNQDRAKDHPTSAHTPAVSFLDSA